MQRRRVDSIMSRLMKFPAYLIVDDGAPVNLMYHGNPQREHIFYVPTDFTRRFADVCHRYGIRGKFSVLPMPSGLGRIDESLSHVPRLLLAEFLDIVRKQIAPLFDISPEILTHLQAYNLKNHALMHIYEDVWVGQATWQEIADYVALALEILNNVNLPANGVTSPWKTGQDNEKNYARGIAEAMWRVNKRKLSWYFLHGLELGGPAWPWIAYADAQRGLKVVHVQDNTDDPFWPMQFNHSDVAPQFWMNQRLDRMLTEDGKTGRVRTLVDRGMPIAIVTHWQSLFCQGRGDGLKGLEELARRMKKHFAKDVEWATCSEMADRTVKGKTPTSKRLPSHRRQAHVV